MSNLPPGLQHELDLAWVGAHMASILYGVFLVLSLASLRNLWGRRSWFFIGYTVLLLCTTTAYYGIAINLEQTELIDDPQSTITYPLNKDLAVTSLWLVDQTMVDGLLVYRCYVIWGDIRRVLILPFLLFLAAFASYVALLVATAHPGSNWSTNSVARLNTLSWSLSTAVEVVAALMIALRLLHHRYQLRKILQKEHLRQYTSVPTILLESATLYAAVGIATIVVVSLKSELAAVFVPIFGLVQSITPNLILYRVSTGRSISPETMSRMRSEVVFASRSGGGTAGGYTTNTQITTTASELA